MTAEPNPAYDLIGHGSLLTADPILAYDLIVMHSILLAAELGITKTRIGYTLGRK